MKTVGLNELVTDVDLPVQYCNRLLSQAEGVGLDFYTINFTRYACSDVQISTEGQRIYNSCLLNVPQYACYDQRLQFGFGDKHLIRNAGIQLYEYEHLLLASALAEFFSEDYAAAILNCLGDFYEDEDRVKPHLSSFKGFVRAWNGLLSFSGFPLIVDDRIRLNPYQDHDRGRPHATTTTEFVPIDKVALAVRMLGQLKSGKVKELTFLGGDIIGWFSAFVEVFLGISQRLTDRDGNIIYERNGQICTVKLIFMPPDSSPTDSDPSVIWLRKPINMTKRSNEIPPILTGRVVGESIFSKVFGRAFHRLDQTEARVFGNALGGLARAWELEAREDDGQLGMDAAKSDPGSTGIGLIQLWTNWFPELRHLQGRMERAMKLDRKQAGERCHESITHLEPLCGCYICTKAEGSDGNPTNLPRDDFCIPTMMETIIMLGLSLSRVTLVPDLYPSRAGILAMYKAQVQKRIDIKQYDINDRARFVTLFGRDWNATTSRRLQNIVTLFSGSRPTVDLPDNLMAISHEGMCAYVLKLQRGDQAAPSADDQVIRVVMGHITWRQKIYSRLCLGCVQPPVEIGSGWESLTTSHFKEKMYVK